MLPLLFQTLEQSFGSTLSQAAFVIYWSAVLLLAYTLAAPIYRLWVEYATVRTGLERQWIMTCPQCGERTIVQGRRCANCRGNLEIPLTVRLWHAGTMRRESRLVRWLRWTIHGLAITGFVAASLVGMLMTGALAPQGELHRLFLGVAITAWAAVGWLAGRALHLGPGGPLGRLRDAVLAMAAIGILAMALFLAHMARQNQEFTLVRFSTEGGMARLADQSLPLTGGEIEFEYLQLDHALLGYHEIIGLALQGQGRVPIPRRNLKQWTLRHLWEYADAYAARGLTVRRLTERLHVERDQSYEVVLRGRDITVRRIVEGKS
jgi:hypothetical protein